MLHKEPKFSHKIADKLLVRLYQCMKVNTWTTKILNQQRKFYSWLYKGNTAICTFTLKYSAADFF